ncbi:acyl-CoA dehydrogenase family protein [Streptomyces sp. NPDC002577]
MSIALNQEQSALAESVEGFASRHAPRSRTRTAADLAAGPVDRDPASGDSDAVRRTRQHEDSLWAALVEQGFATVHLPEDAGGGGGGVGDLAVVVEEAARGLMPGALLPTAIAGAILTRSCPPTRSDATSGDESPGNHGAAVPALRGRFGAGARGAVALYPDGMVAARVPGGYRVNGTSVPVLGGARADVVLLMARHEYGQVVFAVDLATAGGLAVEPLPAVDLTRDIARFTADDLVVPAADTVPVDPSTVRSMAAALCAAEAVGLARWCVETGLEYVKVREQFGRPVGSYQAIKHKCARLFIRLETMAAAAWDAARAADADGPDAEEQLALAAAEAAVVCLPGASDLALDTITLLGGIGYTWEHDVHFFWRRAMTMESLLGPVSRWQRRLGRLARTAGRSFDVALTHDDATFRARIAEQLEEVATLPEEQRQARLSTLGLVLPHYPAPYGIDASPAQQIVIAQEYAKAGVERPKTIIGEWVLPTILAHGTDEQKQFFVPATLRGDIIWCQLFSEPGAGSDLASLSTRAEKTDDGWRLNGQKVWTSSAAEAHWGLCLARTDPAAPKHKGISCFLVDMRAPGLEVRPLREANGGYLFNEVFLTDVFVPDDRLVGAVNEGWAMARTTLGNERVSMGGMIGTGADPVAMSTSPQVMADAPEVERSLGELMAERYALSALGLRATLRQLSGLRPGAEASVLKVAAGWHHQHVSAEVMRWHGPYAAAATGPGGAATHGYLSVPPQLIGGGTAEIQLNVIAERILGLPRG